MGGGKENDENGIPDDVDGGHHGGLKAPLRRHQVDDRHGQTRHMIRMQGLTDDFTRRIRESPSNG